MTLRVPAGARQRRLVKPRPRIHQNEAPASQGSTTISPTAVGVCRPVSNTPVWTVGPVERIAIGVRAGGVTHTVRAPANMTNLFAVTSNRDSTGHGVVCRTQKRAQRQNGCRRNNDLSHGAPLISSIGDRKLCSCEQTMNENGPVAKMASSGSRRLAACQRMKLSGPAVR